MTNHGKAVHKHDGSSGNDDLTATDAHTILSCARRREALRIIVSRGSIRKCELVDEVGAREYGKPARQMSAQERKRIHVSLHQTHLPKLVDYGVVEQERDVFSVGRNAADVQAFDHDSRSPGIVKRAVNAVSTAL